MQITSFHHNAIGDVRPRQLGSTMAFEDKTGMGKAGMDKTGADRLAQVLARHGCRHAFGIPGGEVLALVEALAGAGIEPVLVKHENAGGFMAEGVWHAMANQGHEAPALLYATLGPGVANAVNVVANAMQDRVPLIFITGCVDEADAQSYTHQVFDHQAMLRPIVKASLRATSATAGLVAEQAVRIAMSGRPGPVHIDLPISVAESASIEASGVPSPAAALSAPAPSADLAAARRLFADAQRPVIIAGLDVVNQGAGEALANLARRFAIPVVTTYKAKGVLPENDPLCLGGAGLSPKADKLILPLVQQSDCIILAGYDPIEMRINWRSPWPADAPVIDIVAEAMPHGMHASRHLFVGDVAATLAMLTEGATPHNVWSGGEPGHARAALQAAFAVQGHWGPHQVFATMRGALPPQTVITADSGAHRILLSQMWEATGPRMMLQSSGLCTMGCAVPLAAGYRLAAPDVPVCAFVGDAGLEMMLGDLATIRDLALPVIICVLVDESLALIEMKQRATQRPNRAVDFGGTDFPAIAHAFGGSGVWIDDSQALADETKAALTREHFTILACRIARRAYDGAF
jgi:acetolactate synthase I/II/III large subunit